MVSPGSSHHVFRWALLHPTLPLALTCECGAEDIGVPLPDTDARIVDLDTGQDVAPGQAGELWLREL
jgi:acyl-CoA synthetase (AMP-forming)/AMP-acid ligase II